MIRRSVLLAVVLTFLCNSILTGQQISSPAAIDLTDLHLSFLPFSDPKREEMPVEVLKFVVNLGDSGTIWVHEWRLLNRSDKKVVKIRPTLFVYKEDDPETILLRHELFYAGVSLGLGKIWPSQQCQGYWCPNAFAIIPTNPLLKPLAENGKIEGNYVISLGIDRVEYADGTSWELSARPPAILIKRGPAKASP